VINTRKLLISALLPAALLAACGGGDDSLDDRLGIADPKVRLVHAVPGAPNVSLFRDGQAQGPEVTNLAYEGASKYFDTSTDTRRWDVRTATTPAVTVGSVTFETHRGNKYTLIAVPASGSLTDVALIDDPYEKSVTSDNARVRVFNAAFNTPGIDVYLTPPGTNLSTVGPTFAAVAYKQASPASGADSIELEGGAYTLRLTTAGTKTVLFTAAVTLAENADWLLMPVPASATPGDMKVLVIQSDAGVPATELSNQP
jgi:Domain of unknown function (DUF4397)